MKYVAPVIAGLAVAFVVSFGLGLLGSAAEAKGGGGLGLATWLPGVILGAFTAYILANLAGNRRVAAASEADRSGALSFSAPSDQARLYVVREGFVGKAAGMDVWVDGEHVTQLKAPRFASLLLPPGRHAVTAAFGGLAGAQNNPAEHVLSLAPGEAAAVRVGVSMGALKNSITLQRVQLDEPLQRKLRGMKMVAAETA